jgi:hypothetical protein
VTYVVTGGHTITAQYLGDSSYLASTTSSGITQTVNKDATTTTVSEAPTSVIYGNESSAVFSATVTTQHGEAAPNGDTITVSVNSGAATCTITLPASNCTIGNTAVGAGGPYAVSATFNGDSNLATSTGNASTGLTVSKASTTTSVVSTTGSPSVVNQPVTYTATVTSGAGTPPSSDVVTFKDGVTPITCGSGSFDGTTATCVFTYPSTVGSPHSITAVFGGDANYTTSTSSPISQQVNAFGTATKLAFVQQPTNAFISPATIAPAVTVAVEDAYGNVVTNNTSNVTLTKLSGAGSLTGGGPFAAVNGVATFNSLSLSLVGPYTLSATGSFTSATSSTFYIYSATTTISKSQGNANSAMTNNFTALPNTSYLVFVSETGAQANNPTMTTTLANGATLSSSPVASNFVATTQGANEWVYTLSGATANTSGNVKAQFVAQSSRIDIWVVQLGGENVTNPVVTSNTRAATGTSTGQPITVTLPSAPATGDAGMLFVHITANVSAPTVTPTTTNTTWTPNAGGSAGYWCMPTASQTDTVSNVASGNVWFALAIEIAHV